MATFQSDPILQANALSPPDPSKDHKNWDDSNLQRALADDDHNKAQHALEQVDHAHTDRPEARQITSTQTLHDAPLSDRQSMQLDSVVPAAMTSEDSTKAPLQPHHLNADHELAMAQLLANTNGSPDALQQENGHTPQQAYSGPREVHQRELSMVAPATVAVSTEALEQMHQSSPTTQTHFNPSQSHPQTLQSADRAQSSGRGQAGMGGGNQHSAQVMRHNTAAPQQQKLYKSSPSQRKGPPPAASPVLMSSPQPSKLKRSMSRNSAISEQSSKQNYRDSVFASMSGVAGSLLFLLFCQHR